MVLKYRRNATGCLPRVYTEREKKEPETWETRARTWKRGGKVSEERENAARPQIKRGGEGRKAVKRPCIRREQLWPTAQRRLLRT